MRKRQFMFFISKRLPLCVMTKSAFFITSCSDFTTRLSFLSLASFGFTTSPNESGWNNHLPAHDMTYQSSVIHSWFSCFGLWKPICHTSPDTFIRDVSISNNKTFGAPASNHLEQALQYPLFLLFLFVDCTVVS